MNKDLEHLKLLSIFHYVVGGLTALFACLPFIHLFIGLSFLTTDFPQEASQSKFPIVMVGVLFTVIPVIFIIGGWALAICTIMAGRKLANQTDYTFCFVVAGVLCVFMPFGTILGVFTIVVLLQDSVKALFNGPEVSEYATGSESWRDG